MPKGIKWVEVTVVQGELNAEFLKSRLEAEGIPAALRFETYFNLVLGAYNPVAVLVPEQYAKMAQDILRPIPPFFLIFLEKIDGFSLFYISCFIIANSFSGVVVGTKPEEYEG